jgi:hypothetical protein
MPFSLARYSPEGHRRRAPTSPINVRGAAAPVRVGVLDCTARPSWPRRNSTPAASHPHRLLHHPRAPMVSTRRLRRVR